MVWVGWPLVTGTGKIVLMAFLGGGVCRCNVLVGQYVTVPVTVPRVSRHVTMMTSGKDLIGSFDLTVSLRVVRGVEQVFGAEKSALVLE